jgi:hypothetical protein
LLRLCKSSSQEVFLYGREAKAGSESGTERRKIWEKPSGEAAKIWEKWEKIWDYFQESGAATGKSGAKTAKSGSEAKEAAHPADGRGVAENPPGIRGREDNASEAGPKVPSERKHDPKKSFLSRLEKTEAPSRDKDGTKSHRAPV